MNPTLIFLSMIICPNIGVLQLSSLCEIIGTQKKKKKSSIYYFVNKSLQALDLL